MPFVVKVKKNCLCNFHAYQYLAICYLCFTGVLARRKLGNSDLGSSMKYPNRHGRPGPYTFRQHQCIKTLNQAIDLRDDFSYHIDSLQTAKDHLSTVKRICFDHRKVIRACGGTVNLSTSTRDRFQHKSGNMRTDCMTLLALVIPRNHKAVGLYNQIRDQYIHLQLPWDEQLMTTWWTSATEIQRELEEQANCTVGLMHDERRRITQFRYDLTTVLQADCLQWSL